MVEVMEALGFVRFRLAGHDRGGRVGYRLALDHPAASSNSPRWTSSPLGTCGTASTRGLPPVPGTGRFYPAAPFPETLIGHDPLFFFDSRAAAGAKPPPDLAPLAGQRNVKSIFDSRALAHYHAAYQDPTRIHAMCEDYRAGRTTDFDHDEADRASAKKIACPVLALWGSSGLCANAGLDALACWREWAADLHGFAVDSGHYLPEENPDATGRALLDFFGAGL